MVYIERETALKIIDNYAKTVTEDGKVIVDAIRDIVAVITPTADVEEVVRCKNCVYANEDGTICRYNVGRDVEPEHFCGYGERSDSIGLEKGSKG